jgi:hypothetical protein
MGRYYEPGRSSSTPAGFATTAASYQIGFGMFPVHPPGFQDFRIPGFQD